MSWKAEPGGSPVSGVKASETGGVNDHETGGSRCCVLNQSSMRIAPLSASSRTMGCSPSSPSTAEALAKRLARCSASLSSASSASRFRLPTMPLASGPDTPLTGSFFGGSGAGGALGLRGISISLSSETGFSSGFGSGLRHYHQHTDCNPERASTVREFLSYRSDTRSSRFTRGSSSPSSTTVIKVSFLTPSSESFFGRLSSSSGS